MFGKTRASFEVLAAHTSPEAYTEPQEERRSSCDNVHHAVFTFFPSIGAARLGTSAK